MSGNLLDPTCLTQEQLERIRLAGLPSSGSRKSERDNIRALLTRLAKEQGEPKTVREWLDRVLADPATRAEVEQEVERMRREQDEPSDG